MNYIYIDESGELANKSDYFVIGAIVVNDSKKLDRLINKVRRLNKKQLRESTEIKGSKIQNNIIKKILKQLNKIDYKTYVVVLDKKNKYKINYKDNYNLLYDIVASELAKEIFIDSKTIIYVDKSKNKEEDIIHFNSMFINNLNNFKKISVNISHSNSVNFKGLQVIDLIVWSVFQSVEHENKEFVDIIDNKVIKRIFED